MENVQSFINAAKSYGVPDAEMFLTPDLFEGRNLSQVSEVLNPSPTGQLITFYTARLHSASIHWPERHRNIRSFLAPPSGQNLRPRMRETFLKNKSEKEETVCWVCNQEAIREHRR